ncbi:MAG: hypothetical protein AABX79_00235 [Nanoarchaeota archaeon]
MKLTSYEKRNYVMNDKDDFVILKKIKSLEKKKLNSKDKEAVDLIRTQLKKNWRSPLIKYLDKIIIKYKK